MAWTSFTTPLAFTPDNGSHKIHQGIVEQIVPGALKHFDLPDLIAALVPSRLSMLNVRAKKKCF